MGYLHHSAGGLHAGAMANAHNCYGGKRRGPKPLFTERMEVRLRPDQAAAMQRIAKTLNLPTAELMRWFVDQGIGAVEGAPAYATLEGAS